MDSNMKINQIMTTEVIFVGPEDTMAKVGDIFRAREIHHLPVVDEEGKVIGIVSKSDYYKLLHTFTLFKTRDVEEYNEAVLNSLLVAEVMTKQVALLHPTDSLQMAASYFKENLFHAIPIVDKNKKLVGILSTYDMLNYAFREPFLLEEE